MHKSQHTCVSGYAASLHLKSLFDGVAGQGAAGLESCVVLLPVGGAVAGLTGSLMPQAYSLRQVDLCNNANFRASFLKIDSCNNAQARENH